MRISAEHLAGELGIAAAAGAGQERVVAFVGAGGKTSAMFATALSAQAFRTIVTTTTMIRDPRVEEGRRIDKVVLDSRLGEPARASGDAVVLESRARPGAGPLVVAAGATPESGKLRGVHPSQVEKLRELCDLVLVEADGARGLPVKAPSPSEPVIPECADIVAGLIGLDCLGSPMDARTVHRPELFGALTGCAEGEPIGAIHLERLIHSPEGLFKDCPSGARRVILLNKADVASPRAVRELLKLLTTSLGEAAPRENSATHTPPSSPSTRILLCSLRGGRIVGWIDLGRGREKWNTAGEAPT